MLSWDIFCTVIDNYGDIGVTWRLARQLAHERQEPVRLWVDDLASFARLAPALDPLGGSQCIDGVQVEPWGGTLPAGVQPMRVVVEAFGCQLPDGFRQAMAGRRPAPVWINLEYLTAEDWAEACHGLASPQPPLDKYFFFPGFSGRTGGLLREAALLAERDAFVADPVAQQAFLARLGLSALPPGQPRISLFAYDNPAVPVWLDTVAAGDEALTVLVPDGRVLDSVADWLGRRPAVGEVVSRGALTLAVLPFVAQPDYDRLLWCCEENFVRGEDSFVRAQWAGQPLTWHIYRQEEDAHLVKLEAWLQRWCEGLDAPVAGAARAWQLAWNARPENVPQAWRQWRAVRPALAAQARRWVKMRTGDGDLASNLARFCESLL